MANSNDDLFVQLGMLGMNVEFFRQTRPSRAQLSELLTKVTELTRKYSGETRLRDDAELLTI